MGSLQRRPIRARRAARWIWRIVLALTAIFALGAGTSVGYVYFRSPTVRRMVHDWRRGLWRTEKAFPGTDEVTMLLLGRDVDLDRRARTVNTNARTDTILLVRLNFTARTANVLSIPRDTLVRIPGYRGKHKINSAHAFGGPELVARTIEQFLNVHADHYAVANYESFEKAVDLLGGIEVNVPKQMDYDDNWGKLHIHLNPGVQVLSGEQALGFARFRKSNDGDADTDQERILRQQQVLMAAKRRIVSAPAFFRVPDVIEAVRGGVQSSMSDAQLMAAANFIRSLPSEVVHMATLPNGAGGIYASAAEDAAQEIIDRMFRERGTSL